jgi:hypothetical protein
MKSKTDTGLCIPYTVNMTPDKGRGVFADSAVRKGTTVWRHVPGQYAVYDERSLKTLLARSSPSEAVYELTHIHGVAEFPGYMIKVYDHGELINHSDQPTIVVKSSAAGYEVPRVSSTEEVSAALLESGYALVATQDLIAGDELTLDYNADPNDPSYYSSLCEQYGVSWDWLE